MTRVNPKDFALAVISGNSCPGSTPDEIAKNALSLYQSALLEAEKYNEENPATAKVSKRPDWL
ncbi:TPA: hypothetical protein ACGBG5_003556 [Enterococcus faecalis]